MAAATPPSQADEPISTYFERLPQVRRALRLYQDRVEIDAAWTLGRRYRQTVRLADLNAQATRFDARDRWFRRAMTIGMLALAAAVIFTRPDRAEWVRQVFKAGYGIAAVCAYLVVLTYGRRQYVRFLHISGRPGLDICRSGPDRGRFDEFVVQVQKRIRRQG